MEKLRFLMKLEEQKRSPLFQIFWPTKTGIDNMALLVPPIKSQGIKSKLAPWIREILSGLERLPRVWREPFLGTGVVPLNLPFSTYLLSDVNPHIIQFYTALKSGEITCQDIRKYLSAEGEALGRLGEERYYFVRDRFNKNHDPLDFLFLNRSCFNGMIRFNRQGQFNVPFCRKPARFSAAYITKIVNQSRRMEEFLHNHDVLLSCADFRDALKNMDEDEIIYCDPPYIDRYVDYYNGWTSDDEEDLFHILDRTKSKFILSTWHHNKFRRNTYIDKYWKKFNIFTKKHFYHLGGSISNRNVMVESLVTNIDKKTPMKDNFYQHSKQQQLRLSLADVQL